MSIAPVTTRAYAWEPPRATSEAATVIVQTPFAGERRRTPSSTFTRSAAPPSADWPGFASLSSRVAYVGKTFPRYTRPKGSVTVRSRSFTSCLTAPGVPG